VPTYAFIALSAAVLIAIGLSWTVLSQDESLEIICPPMLLLAGALLEPVAAGLLLASCAAAVGAVWAVEHRRPIEGVALCAFYCAVVAGGRLLSRSRRRWLSRELTDPDPEGEVRVIGRRAAAAINRSAIVPEAALHPDLAVLSRRERDVALLAIQGLTSREIGTRLSIAERTVESHLASIYDKLHVHSRKALLGRLEDSRAGDRVLRIAE
jgi:DNA-binding CsgD family transcriptional regulator